MSNSFSTQILTLSDLQKHFPKKINQEPRTISYTENLTTFYKDTAVDTANFQPGELIHVEFDRIRPNMSNFSTRALILGHH